jgi:leucyl aminopeptidase (aminopeptidase T)
VPRSDEETLARSVLGQSLGVRPNETVVVEAWSHALPWARAMVVEARRLGAEAVLAFEDEEAYFRSIALAGARRFPSASAALARAADAYVCFDGPEAFSRLLGLPTGALASVLDRHREGWDRAARARRLRAARVVAADVTETLAERYRVHADDWRTEVIRASAVPPALLRESAGRIARRLRRARRLRIVHANGTDLTLELRPRRIAIDDGQIGDDDRAAGHVWTQVPTGKVEVGLAPALAEGRWEGNRPVYDRFDDPSVTLAPSFEFRGGRLRAFSFEHGGDSFPAAYRRAGPGRDRPSALSFGLNPRIRLAPELGEFALGSVTFLLGRNPPAGGRRAAPFVYRSTLSGADVLLDDLPFLREGRLVASRD